jgi:hypothetical protein
MVFVIILLQADSAYKSPVGGILSGIERNLSQSAGQSPVSVSINSSTATNPAENLTTVYSIVMDDTVADDSGLDQLGDHHISSEHEVELNSAVDGVAVDKAHQISEQIQISTSTSPLSIIPGSTGVGTGSGSHVGLVAKRSLLHSQSVKVSPSSRSVSINSNNFRGSSGVETSPQDDQVSYIGYMIVLVEFG